MAAVGQNILALWAKLDTGGGASRYHPLLCHLLDVAGVAAVAWRISVADAAGTRLAARLGMDPAALGSWVAFLAGLHDLGKASPAFQTRDPAAESYLAAHGYPPPGAVAQAPPHGTLTARTLPDILEAHFGVTRNVANTLAIAIGSHHGTIPTAGEIAPNAVPARAVGSGQWASAREEIARAVASATGANPGTGPTTIDAAAAMLLAGFVSVVDWIGSTETFFPYAPSTVELDPAAYFADAMGRAENALDHLGWTPWPSPVDTRTFRALFPHIATPNPLQQEVEQLANRLDTAEPSLTIIEAPTGEGKTEAALFLADYLAAAAKQRGLYIALPTQATSNQMFGRVRAFLEHRYPDQPVNLQLLHGHASLSAEFRLLQDDARALLQPTEANDEDATRAGVIAAEWFTYRKRGLLAPFGVGTVDQGLLAVLPTRHVFVRLFGLALKTVIIDEVHAYDTYMTALLERLLEWLASLGSSVILLSATLPAARRTALMDAYQKGLRLEDAAQASPPPPYPRVTWLTRGTSGGETVGVSPLNQRAITLRWIADAPGAGPLGAQLAGALAAGGCAAVICNTVRRAQDVYQALQPYFPGTADDGLPELDLLHARFPFENRAEREARCLARFGKDGNTVEMPGSGTRGVRRPNRAVLVATQIIEQSLDLDFDLMVSDIAPADLLLQRAGRLHRHARPRPPALPTPQLWLTGPDLQPDGTPSFDRGTGAVYDRHVLLRSWLALRDREHVRVPEDVEAIIDAVYADKPCPSDAGPAIAAMWDATGREHEVTVAADRGEAATKWLKQPSFNGLLSSVVPTTQLEEDAPELHSAFQALTRLAEPSVDVVCLYGSPNGTLTLDRAGHERVQLTAQVTNAVARRLLQRSVALTDRRIIYDLFQLDPPKSWARSALLRRYRPLIFDADGRATVGRYTVVLDDQLGIVVTRSGSQSGE